MPGPLRAWVLTDLGRDWTVGLKHETQPRPFWRAVPGQPITIQSRTELITVAGGAGPSMDIPAQLTPLYTAIFLTLHNLGHLLKIVQKTSISSHIPSFKTIKFPLFNISLKFVISLNHL